MLLRSLLSLLLVFGLANTTTAAASSSHLSANQQVEWYSDLQGDRTTKTYSFFQSEKTFGQQHTIRAFSQANGFTTRVISVKIKLQNQRYPHQTENAPLRPKMPLYPEEDSASLMAS